MIFSLFPLSRCTENSNRTNSLEALSVSMRIISNLSVCVCMCVCATLYYIAGLLSYHCIVAMSRE